MAFNVVEIPAIVKELIKTSETTGKLKEILDDLEELIRDIKDVLMIDKN